MTKILEKTSQSLQCVLGRRSVTCSSVSVLGAILRMHEGNVLRSVDNHDHLYTWQPAKNISTNVLSARQDECLAGHLPRAN
jgi:hypothetical protein